MDKLVILNEISMGNSNSQDNCKLVAGCGRKEKNMNQIHQNKKKQIPISRYPAIAVTNRCVRDMSVRRIKYIIHMQISEHSRQCENR